MSRVPAGMAATVLTAVGTACIAAPLPPRPETAGTVAGRSPTGRAAELLVPPGNGTLRQDDITLTLEAGDLQLKVTPLEEWVGPADRAGHLVAAVRARAGAPCGGRAADRTARSALPGVLLQQGAGRELPLR